MAAKLGALSTALLCISSVPGILQGQSGAETGGAQSRPTVEAIVARHVQAIGGEAAWARVATQTKQGIALAGVADLALETYSKAPDKWMFAITLPNKRILKHAASGTDGWEDGGAPRPMEHQAAGEEGLIYNPFWTLKLKEYFPGLTLKGREKNGEHEVYVVEATPPQGRPKILFFDVETGLLTRAGKVMFDDYREVDGLRVPFLVRYGWQTFKFSAIQHGVSLDDTRFRMPPVPVKPPEEKPTEPLPAVGEIMDRYIQALGGEPALSRWKTQARRGTLREDEVTVPVQTLAKGPDKWLLVVDTGAGGSDKQGYDGRKAWFETTDVIKDMDLNQQIEQAGFLDFELPLKLNQLRANMTAVRTEKRADRDLNVVDVAPASGRHQRLWFDPETGLLAQIGGVLLEDYTLVDGVRIPHTVKLRGGRVTVKFSEVAHDVPIDDARFSKPLPSPAYEKNFAGIDSPPAVEALKQSAGEGLPPSEGRLLYDLIVTKGYKRALDVGTGSGSSALWFGLAVKKNGGEIITVEIDPETADAARERFQQAGLSGVIDSRINDALREIPVIRGQFDFVFMDPGMPLDKKLFDLLYPRLRPGGAIVAHNAKGFQSEQPDFLKAIQSDPNLETRIIETREGISVSIKRGL